MSHSKKPDSELGFDGLSDRLRKSLTTKPDNTKNKPGSGSPISPLRGGPTVSSSSSSSSGSVAGRTGTGLNVGSTTKKSDSGGTTNNSGELSVDSSPKFSAGGSRGVKSGQTRSEAGSGSPKVNPSKFTGGSSATSPAVNVPPGSGSPKVNPSKFTGGSSATSPAVNVLPAGNICPSGRVIKTGMMSNRSSKPEVLSLGSGIYGHGSIMRGGPIVKPAGAVTGGRRENPVSRRSSSVDPEDLMRLGNEEYKKGHFIEALSFYDRAISLSPANAAYHCNRAAALMCLNRFTEAVKGCEQAIKLDSAYVRAHQRLGSLLISLGQVENARMHLCFPGYQPDPKELQKLQEVEKRLNKCTDCRRARDWVGALRESEAAISSGADSCPQLFACNAEALLKIRQLDDADSIFSNIPKFAASSTLSCSQSKFFGMPSETYLLFVRAQIDMSLGRFENAVTSIEKAAHIEPRNVEIAVLLQNIRSVSRARARGNDLFKSERFTEACSAYAEGLRLDSSNPILYCNRAACWFKLGLLEKSLDDCNQALILHPKYTKALLRRAATYSKLERWAESVRDYEALRMELPDNSDIAESLFHAQVALKKSLGEEVYNMKFGGEVELIAGLDQFKAAVASTGASVVLFKTKSDLQCKQISPFLDTLCTRYPSVNFHKVDIEESPSIANVENVRIVPTIKIYKKGNRVKEMVCPGREVLESSVRHYSL